MFFTMPNIKTSVLAVLSVFAASDLLSCDDTCEKEKSRSAAMNVQGLALMSMDLGYARNGESAGFVMLKEDAADITKLSSLESVQAHVPALNYLENTGSGKSSNKGVAYGQTRLSNNDEIEVPLVRMSVRELPDGEKPKHSRGYEIKAYVERGGVLDESQLGRSDTAKKNLAYAVKVLGGYKKSAESAEFVPESDVADGVYEITASRKEYCAKLQDKEFTVRQNFKKAGVPKDDVWQYDLSGVPMTAKKSVEKIRVCNKDAEDAFFTVRTEVSQKGDRILEQQTIEYEMYPILKDEGGRIVFDKERAQKVVLPSIYRESVVTVNGTLDVASEEVREYNLAQGRGERELRGTVKAAKGREGTWILFEYDGAAPIPSKAYRSLDSNINSMAKVAIGDLIGTRVETTAYDLANEGGWRVAGASKSVGVLSDDLTLKNERPISRVTYARSGEMNVEFDHAFHPASPRNKAAKQLRSEGFSIKAPENPEEPPVFVRDGKGEYVVIYKMRLHENNEGATDIRLPFGQVYKSASPVSFDEAAPRAVEVEVHDFVTKLPVYTAKYVQNSDGKFVPVQWKYSVCEKTWPYSVLEFREKKAGIDVVVSKND